MAKRSLLLVSVFASLFAPPFLTSAQVFGPVGRGGVVGGDAPPSPKPAASASAPKPALNLPPAITIPAPSSFPAEPEDPIERSEFQNKAHPVAKSLTSATAMMIQRTPDGSEIGLVSEVNAAVAAGSRQGKDAKAVFVSKQAKVGPQMDASFDEAIRAVQVRYPMWEPALINFSFDERSTPHEGGSAGTCFATMLLSELEGFNIDPKCAVTGDITVNWHVKQIGGLPAKLRGATAGGCLYAGIPLENANDISDLALLYGVSSLCDIQIFSLQTLQDAVRLMRTDRPPRLAAAIKAFNDLQPRLKGGKPALEDKQTQKSLEEILALAPNHQSARWLLETGRGTAPKTVTIGYAMEQIGILLDPYTDILIGLPINRTTVSSAMTENARKQLAQLTPITPTELQPLVRDLRAIVESANAIALNTARPESFRDKVIAFHNDAEALSSNKSFFEKYLRGK